MALMLDRESVLQKLFAVLGRGLSDLRQHRPASAGRAGNLAASHGFRCLLESQRLDELIEEQCHAVGELVLCHIRRGPLRDFQPASRDQLTAVSGQELVHHGRRTTLIQALSVS